MRIKLKNKKNAQTKSFRSDILFMLYAFRHQPKTEPDDKPGYVLNDHLSRLTVASKLKRPT